jgi:hypothetical protein
MSKTTPIKKLENILESERREHGLIAFGMFSAYGASASILARESVEMHEAYLRGEYTDITSQPI